VAILAEGFLPDFLTPEGQVVLWSFLVFFGLLALLWKFAWGPIMHALEEREHNIQKKIDDAEQKNKEAIAKVAEYEKKIMAARDETAAIIAQGKKDVERIKEEILAEANKEGAKTLERAKKEIELARQAAVVDIRNRVIELSAELSAKVIQREVKPDDHRRFIEEAIVNVGQTN
jgi:F-type H+-transporting ATPase subunit b